MDRLLALARRAHDASLCPSGAGPQHYRDECDEDSENFTDPEPEVVESTCAWLVAQQEYDEENSKEGHIPEKGLLVGWRDASVPPLGSPRLPDDQVRGDDSPGELSKSQNHQESPRPGAARDRDEYAEKDQDDADPDAEPELSNGLHDDSITK